MSALIDAELTERQARTTGWEDRLRRLYGAAKAGPAKIAAAALVLYLLIFQSPWCGGWPSRFASSSRRSRPTPWSCLPAAWVSRDGPVAACRSAFAKRWSCIATAWRRG